jgi:ABC-type antimicrobial peptide transport system permease subunit
MVRAVLVEKPDVHDADDQDARGSAALLPSIRRVVHAIDPDIAIGQSRPLQQGVAASLSGRRYQMMLFVTFAGAAFQIAMVGVYAVTAYGVTQRRREMNIRVALGARRSQILGLIVRQTGTPVAGGALAGAAAAVAIGGIMASLLFDVPARDPLILAGVVGLVGAGGLAACLFAARRELVIDPRWRCGRTSGRSSIQ